MFKRKKKEEAEEQNPDVIDTGEEDIYNVDEEKEQSQPQVKIITPELIMAECIEKMSNNFEKWTVRIEKRITIMEDILRKK